jgi:tetratricopeptide (TPR) repeat protein
MSYFKQKVDENDIFIFYIMTHGHPAAVVQLARKQMWKAEEIQTALSGLKSKTNIFCFETCHAGAILNKVDFPNAVCVAAAPAETPGWVDRNFANCVNFIEAKADTKNDKNSDGVVDVNEAFEVVKKKAAEYEPKWREYLKTKYKMPKNSPVPPNMLDKTSLNAVLKSGKEYVEKNLFGVTKEVAKKIEEKKKPVEKKISAEGEKPVEESDKTLLEQADALLKEGKQLEAYRIYERLSSSKDSNVAAEAKNKMDELLKDEKFAASLKEMKEKEDVEKKLATARNYVENKMFDKARQLCEEVLEKYPNTEYAEEAKKILDEIKQKENE